MLARRRSHFSCCQLSVAARERDRAREIAPRDLCVLVRFYSFVFRANDIASTTLGHPFGADNTFGRMYVSRQMEFTCFSESARGTCGSFEASTSIFALSTRAVDVPRHLPIARAFRLADDASGEC